MKCDKSMTFEECELHILRGAIDRAEQIKGEDLTSDPEIKNIIDIVEEFIRDKSLICYGGTAINNLLPEEDQFYDLTIQIPDYDMYSPNAIKHAKELADIYVERGYTEVEARAGIHHGTYKVFVNYLPIADITQIPREIYRNIKEQSRSVAGIKYAPINLLRLNMYRELSQPKGDIGRWEKVLKRLVLFNKNYPLRGTNCRPDDIQRTFEESDDITKDDIKKLYHIVRISFIDQGLVFFGSYASSLYLQKLRTKERIRTKQIPDFDVLSENPELSAEIVKERLLEEGYENVNIKKRSGVGEIISPHYELRVGDETVAFIYQPFGCHSYNAIRVHKKLVKIATIDTMLNLYLAFLYADREYYDENRIYCLGEYMFRVQQQNRLRQNGILKRFSLDCYGEPITIQHILKERQEKYKELRNKRNGEEFESWFLRYRPADEKEEKKRKKQSDKKTKKKRAKNGRKTRKNILDFIGL